MPAVFWLSPRKSKRYQRPHGALLPLATGEGWDGVDTGNARTLAISDGTRPHPLLPPRSRGKEAVCSVRAKGRAGTNWIARKAAVFVIPRGEFPQWKPLRETGRLVQGMRCIDRRRQQ